MQKSRPTQKPNAALFDVQALLVWYDRHARNLPWRVSPQQRELGVRPDPYRVWLSEIMLQQTTVFTVREYFGRFTSLWPRVEDLANAPLNDVLAAWAGLGYYARARNLHAAAQKVAFELNGKFPDNDLELRTLPGIGPYTSAAIAAICHDERVAVVDGNVDRVMARQLLLSRPVRDEKPAIKDAVQALVPERAGDFAQAMMDLGATICAPRVANCDRCPLEPDCAAAVLPDPAIYPVKPEKAVKPTRFGHAYVMANAEGDVWLRRRPDKGLLAKMTEVPGSAWDAVPPLADYPVDGAWQKRGDVVHVFTHFRLELQVWYLQAPIARPMNEGWWSALDLVQGEALPTLYRKVLAVVG